jgi:hypothetical protein
MRKGWLPGSSAYFEQKRMIEGLHSTGSDLGRKFRVALILYAILAALSWFTLDGKIPVGGRLVELRLVPLVIIGGLALRTVLAMKAEKIRREGEQGQ